MAGAGAFVRIHTHPACINILTRLLTKFNVMKFPEKEKGS